MSFAISNKSFIITVSTLPRHLVVKLTRINNKYKIGTECTVKDDILVTKNKIRAGTIGFFSYLGFAYLQPSSQHTNLRTIENNLFRVP